MTELFVLTSQVVVPKAARKAKRQAATIPPANSRERYALTKHCCRVCFGRVLKVDRVSTGQDKPSIYRCADCGVSGAGGPTSICACDTKFNTGRSMGIRCIVNPERGPISPSIIVATEGPCS